MAGTNTVPTTIIRPEREREREREREGEREREVNALEGSKVHTLTQESHMFESCPALQFHTISCKAPTDPTHPSPHPPAPPVSQTQCRLPDSRHQICQPPPSPADTRSLRLGGCDDARTLTGRLHDTTAESRNPEECKEQRERDD